MPKPNRPAERIRQALAAAGVSQSALARYCGVSRQLVSLWVHNDPASRSSPSGEHLALIAARTGATVKWLEHGVGAPPTGKARKPERYAHGSNVRWREQLRETSCHLNPQLSQRFDVSLRLPGLEEDWVFDFVHTRVVAQLIGARTERAYIREQLWKLACLREIDRNVSVERHYRVLLALTPDDERTGTFTAEAALLGIEVVAHEDGVALGKQLAIDAG